MPVFAQGSLNVTSLLIPDVYVQIVPPSQLVLNGIPSNMVGVVGTAAWGPLNTPTSIASMQEFALNFGDIQNRKYDLGTHCAIIALQGGNNMTCIRVSDSTDTIASVAVATNITFNGKYSGTQGNNVTVTIAPGAKTNTWRAIVGVPGFIPEVFENLGAINPPVTGIAHPAVAASANVVFSAPVTGVVVGMVVSGTGIVGTPTVITVTDSTHIVLSAVQTIADNAVLTFTAGNNQIWQSMANAINFGQNTARGASRWVVAVAGVGTTAPTSTTYTLSGGTDGDAITASALFGNGSSTGMYALSGSGLSILDVADMDDPTQFSTIDEFAVAESCYAVLALASGMSVSAAVTAKRTSGVDSYNSKIMMGDWCYWHDPVNQVVRLVSPGAFLAGRLSNLSPEQSSLNKPLQAVAGTQKSGFGSLNAFYSTTDLNNLELNGIDVITNPGGGNLAIFTARFGHNSSTNITVHLDNYTTLTNYVAKTLEQGLGFYLGRPITRQLFGDITATLTQFMQRLTGAGLLVSTDGTTPYGVICGLSNNPRSQTDLGIVQADVQAVFPSILEKFLINMQGGNTVSVSRVTLNQ